MDLQPAADPYNVVCRGVGPWAGAVYGLFYNQGTSSKNYIATWSLKYGGVVSWFTFLTVKAYFDFKVLLPKH